MTRRRLGYLMSRFPNLTETFILREIVVLALGGWPISIYPLIVQTQPVMHQDAAAWLGRVSDVPFVSLAVLWTNVATAVRMPVRYLTTIARALWENRNSPRFLLRTAALIPKSVHMARLMRRDGIEHMHAHYGTHPATAAWIVHRLTGIPYSVTLHAHDLFVDRSMLATKLRDAAFVVTISDYNWRYLSDNVGPWAAAKTLIVRCGVRTPQRRAVAEPLAGARRLEILTVASLQPRKGLHVLIEACALLVQRGVAIRSRIVGDGPLRSAIERQVRELNLQGVVDVIGLRTEAEVEQLLASGDCYVQPSIWLPDGKGEGLPVSIMEAMAAGLPSVASAVAGVPELIRPGETGWLVPPGNAAAIADAVAAIVADPEAARAVGRRGQELVRREYDLELNLRRLEQAFLQAHPPRGAGPRDRPSPQ